MKEPYGLNDLEKDLGDETVLSEVSMVNDDLVEEVATRDEGEDDEDEGVGGDDSVKGNDVGM